MEVDSGAIVCARLLPIASTTLPSMHGTYLTLYMSCLAGSSSHQMTVAPSPSGLPPVRLERGGEEKNSTTTHACTHTHAHTPS